MSLLLWRSVNQSPVHHPDLITFDMNKWKWDQTTRLMKAVFVPVSLQSPLWSFVPGGSTLSSLLHSFSGVLTHSRPLEDSDRLQGSCLRPQLPATTEGRKTKRWGKKISRVAQRVAAIASDCCPETTAAELYSLYM